MFTTAKNGIVATTHPLAAQIGVDVLKGGGNAVDAAVATSAAMGLMEPMSCGIGGDLFAIVYSAKSKKLYGLNASGRAPADISIQAFRDRGLTEIPHTGPLSWSVPGCVDGWSELLGKFGTRPLGELLAPSIKHGREGFPVPATIARMWNNNLQFMSQTPDAFRTFYPEGRAPGEGEIFKNANLAGTYELLAKKGAAEFYQGEIARKIVAFSQQNGGFFSLRDFTGHTSSWVNPVSTDYRGNRVWQIPPPGQGITVLQMLNILEGYDLKSMGHNSADYWHVALEAKKLAYADRARHYADPDFVPVPTEWLISKSYAARRRGLISMEQALTHLDPGDPKLAHSDTIYLSVVDKDRNCVSFIQSNYKGFGSGLVPGDLGFPIQNRGNLFALDEGHPNALQPRKRPFHTIIPGFVTRNVPATTPACAVIPGGGEGIDAGTPHFVFGVMGGDMQPQGQVRVLTSLIDFGMDVHEAGAASRIEHVGSATPTGIAGDNGGRAIAEQIIPAAVIEELRRRGHRIEQGLPTTGSYQGILIDEKSGSLQGASEPRRDGKAIGY